MNALAQVRTGKPASPPPETLPVLFAQRQSTLGGSAAAAPLQDFGRSLAPAVKSEMESGFGRNFDGVRVHDDARAHDSAQALGALAYTVGDHVVFGKGQYAPETLSGRALIAHELAHTVQQGGIQLKADGPLDTAIDQNLERQADRAAEAVIGGRPAPTLTHVGRPILSRATAPKPTGTVNRNPPKNLPAWVAETVNDDPTESEPTELIVVKDQFEMPVEKGAGAWVTEAYNKTKITSTVYTADRMSSFKEDSQTEQYLNIWLGKFGFKSLHDVSTTILKLDKKKPNVTRVLGNKNSDERKFVEALGGGLRKSGSAIDHIIEKHMGGSSVPDNLQLHDAKRNTASGTKSWNKVKELVDDVTAKGMRGEAARKIQIRFNRVTVPEGAPEDPTFQVEKLLRDGDVQGSAAVKQAAEGKDVRLKAGANQATASIKEQGVTEIPDAAARCVSGAYLLTYERRGKKAKYDIVHGELDNRALKKMGRSAKSKGIQFKAEIENASPAAGKANDASSAEGEVEVSETRRLSVDGAQQKVPFEYLYLSPGHLTTVSFDEKGNLTGDGVIEPSVPILGTLNVSVGPDKFELAKPIDVKSLNQSKLVRPLSSMFRFTETSLKIDLLRFKPEGGLKFTIGPEKKPLVLGDIQASAQSGAFVASGNLTPGVAIPGLEGASGNISYSSASGWAGNITASSSKIPYSKLNVTLSFFGEANHFRVEAKGGMNVELPGNKKIDLEAFWGKENLGFQTRFKWVKPLKMVDYIEAHALFVGDLLRVTGKGGFTFRDSWHGDVELTYERKNEAQKFSGKASVDVVTPNKKGKGQIKAEIDEEGRVSGSGKLSYLFINKPKIEPELGVTLDKKGHISIEGAVSLDGPFKIFDRYPKGNEDIKEEITDSPFPTTNVPADSGLKKLIQFDTPKIRIPTPIPTVNGFLEFYAGVFYEIHFGPAALKAIKLSGKIDDLTENPKVEAKLDGKFYCEAGAGLYGRFGGYAGVEVLYGAGELKGGIHITPGIQGNANIEVGMSGEYKEGDFSVKVEPEFNVRLTALLKVTGTITASAFWGFLSKTWPFDIYDWHKDLASKTIKFPSLELSTSTTTKLPGSEGLSEIPAISPIQMIEDLIRGKQGDTAPRDPNYDPNRPPPRDYVGNKI